MSEQSRREFLLSLGQGAIAIMGIRLLSGCEFVNVDQKGGAGGTEAFLTPADDGIWYWQSGQGTSKANAPDIKPEDWKLQITSGSNSIGEITFTDLEQLQDKAVSYWKTMRCVFSTPVGPPIATLVANGIFKGIPLALLLDKFDIPPDTVKIRTYGADGFTSNIPLERITNPASDQLPAIIAYELNAAPMTRLRGGPARLIIPEMWGYKNMKWLNRIDLTSDNSAFGQYETVLFPGNQLIDNPGKISLSTTITTPPSARASIEGPDITIAGMAVVGDANVTKVEVSLDDGPFQTAALIGDDPAQVLLSLSSELQDAMNATAQVGQSWPLPNVWVTWSIAFLGLSRGTHTATVRASDSTGTTQSAENNDVLLVGNEVRIEFDVT